MPLLPLSRIAGKNQHTTTSFWAKEGRIFYNVFLFAAGGMIVLEWLQGLSMNTELYLKRIRYRGSVEPNEQTLRDVHRAHLYTVPFENLDIHLRRPIVLDEEALFEKIVVNRRGGFCYELNGLFAALLIALGFRVSKLCAQVARPEGGYGPPFDHMTLLVHLQEPWIADVGFGDSFLEPLLLKMGLEQYQWGKTYRITEGAGGPLYESKVGGSDSRWNPEYKFRMTPYEFEDYAEMCLYHQTSPESTFTQKRVCSRALPEGRVTLSELKLILTRDGIREVRQLTNDEYEVALREYFGVVLGDKNGS